MGRRNLNPNQIAYLRGKRYETEKKIVSNESGANQYTKEVGSHLATQPKTSEVLGSEYGVHKSTIIRNANFAKVVDILPEEVKHDVLSGEQKISHEATSSILKFDKPTQKKFIKEKNGITFLSIWRLKNQPRNKYPNFGVCKRSAEISADVHARNYGYVNTQNYGCLKDGEFHL